jgi:hypothetical protein
LGSYNDPIFGFTKASFVCQARISSNNVNIDSAVNVFRSLELHLKYSSSYGEQADNQTIKVYRLLKDISIDSTYYENFSLLPTDYVLLAEAPLVFNATDSLIKITLPESLYQEFKNSSPTPNFVDNTTFLAFFKGFYITTENVSSGGCIFNINVLADESRMVLNYNDTSEYYFNINSKSAIINMFEHDYSTASTELQTVLADTTQLYDNCYVQSLGGLKTKLFFPELETLLDSTNVAINKAQLVITVNTSLSGTMFAPPPKLTLVAILESGKYDFISDYKLNSSFFGGSYNSSTYTYIFNIPFHLQELVNGNEDYGIYLFPTNNRTSAYRSVLHANNASEMQMKLEIYYSKY